MQKVKFRAWDPGLKKMFFDGFAIIPTSPDWSGIFIRGIKDDKLQRLINDYYKDIGDVLEGDYDLIDWTEYTQLELMRFTGLTDKNEVEAYDQDIYKNGENGLIGLFHIEESIGGYILFCTEYKNGQIHTHIPFIELDLTDFEVIGNIHQDKHLLD